MSEQSGFIKPNFPRRVLLILPFVVFALVSLTAGFVASRTNALAYKTPFFHLFFSDVLHMKIWLVTATLVLGLGQLPTASRMYALLRFPPQGRFYNIVHRWSGRVAILLTVPVASPLPSLVFHALTTARQFCLAYSQSNEVRELHHSVDVLLLPVRYISCRRS